MEKNHATYLVAILATTSGQESIQMSICCESFACKLIFDMGRPFFVLVRSPERQLLFLAILATTSGHGGQ